MSEVNDGLVVERSKPPGLEELNSEVRSELMLFLGRNDIDFFITKKTVGKARKEFNAGRGKGSRANPVQFREAIDEACSFWKVRRRKPMSKSTSIGWDAWDRLKERVEPLLPLMRGLTLDECVELARSKVSTNKSQLSGLPVRFHVWREKGGG